VEGDPQLMLLVVTKAVSRRLSDDTISVREAALSLVDHMSSHQGLPTHFILFTMACLTDAGVSVRKRAVRSPGHPDVESAIQPIGGMRRHAPLCRRSQGGRMAFVISSMIYLESCGCRTKMLSSQVPREILRHQTAPCHLEQHTTDPPMVWSSGVLL
jgi:hypothetical protein